MQLEFKPDFEETAERWEAFWKGEGGRPMIDAIIPKPGLKPVEKPGYTSGAVGDFAPVVDQLLRWAETHEFLGDAIPFYYLEFAADQFASFLGADLKFHADGHGHGWAVPFVEEWDDVELGFQREGSWWCRVAECARALRERCDGKLLIASPTLVANLDALAAVRGPERLLMDLIESPDAVHRALEQVSRAYREILDELANLLGYETWGSVNRFGMYTRGRINVPQCDFSCMISPGMFREFVVPCLRQEAEELDHAVYHLDGPGAIKHLEDVCGIEGIEIIQWVAGAGAPQEQDWTALYDRIDALGKGLFLGGGAEGLKRFAKRFRSPKQFYRLKARTRDDVDRLIDDLTAMNG